MQDKAWADGLAELLASFPSQAQDQDVLTKRGEVYRRELGNLTDEAWLYAVREAIRSERWFPTVSVLLDYAARAPVPAPRALLPDDTRTPDERRADAKRMLEQLRVAIGVEDLPAAVNGMPKPDTVVVVTDERAAELRRQAAVIQG